MDRINFSELKSYLLKFYSMYEEVYIYYLRNVNLYNQYVPSEISCFLEKLTYIKKDWNKLIDENLSEYNEESINFSQYVSEFKSSTCKLLTLYDFFDKDIRYIIFKNKKNEESEIYFNLIEQICSCTKQIGLVQDYIESNPVVQDEKQAWYVKSMFNVELKRDNIKRIANIANATDKDDRTARWFAVLCFFLFSLFASFILTYFVHLLGAEDIISLFVIFFSICFFPMSALFLFVPSRWLWKGSFYSGSKKNIQGDLTAGWKLKNYNPESWRRKNGSDIFKRSGRPSKKW